MTYLFQCLLNIQDSNSSSDMESKSGSTSIDGMGFLAFFLRNRLGFGFSTGFFLTAGGILKTVSMVLNLILQSRQYLVLVLPPSKSLGVL